MEKILLNVPTLHIINAIAISIVPFFCIPNCKIFLYLIGHSDDKYEVSEVEPVEGEEVTYQISMTIFDVKDQDHDDSYEVQVSNGLGILEKKLYYDFICLINF